MDVFLSGRKKTSEDAKASNSTTLKNCQAETTSEPIKKHMPWVEKYRPKRVEEIAYQDEVTAVLKRCLDGTSDIPNMLLYGPPGTGKTSAILAMAMQIFGAESYRDRVLELNASDERGIQVIRDKVKRFSQYAATGYRQDGKPCPALKFVILDEADCMTSAAQAALRRTMEKESKTTRFCLICNYISRIIEPLTSRCAKFRFKPLTNEIQTECLRRICEKEKVAISKEALDALIEMSEGDLRRSITFLQSAASFKIDQEITVEDVNELIGIIPDHVLEQYLTACKKSRCELLEKSVSGLIRQGYSAYQLMNQVHDFYMNDDVTTSDAFKARVFDKLAECEQRLLSGADEFIQLMDLGCSILLAYRSNV